MRWVRSHAKLTSCVALLALTLQLVLSFGHIHRKDVLGRSTQAPSHAIVSLTDQRHGLAQPSDRATHDHENGYCPIYAFNGLISCAQNAEPPALPLPLALHRALPSTANELRLAERRFILSQARAPPIA
jgi:hypothetical protein